MKTDSKPQTTSNVQRLRSKPRSWPLAVLGFILTLLAAGLGFWQVGRGEAKDALSQHEAQAAAIILQGTWLPEHTRYVENRTMQGRTGFVVLTPLLRSVEQDLVIVQRGWIERDRVDPKKLKPIETPSGTVQVHGIWTAWPSKYFSLGVEDERGLVRQNVDPTAFSGALNAQTGRSVFTEQTLREVGGASQGLTRNWDKIASTSAKNYAYALQWFIIGLVLAGLTLWFQWLRPHKTIE